MAEAARGGARSLEQPPPTGVPIAASHGIFRVVAPNPGPMTYHGTNTWFVPDGGGGFVVIDPGPDDASHLDATLRAGDGRISHVLVSHRHRDHLGNAAALSERLGLPLHGHRLLRPFTASPFVTLAHGDPIAGLTAVHTPGHAQDHLCFAHAASKMLFTADHVMGWSTSVVPPPPEGDARDYLASLRLLLARDDSIYLSGHGPPILQPHALVNTLLAQRLRRERELRYLISSEPATRDGLVRAVYPSLKAGLNGAATANIAGLLAKLAEDGVACADADGVWRLVG